MKKSSGKRNAASLDEQFTSLLKATFEMWIHQVLYRRRIYPPSCFAPATVWGVRCYACRAKDVVSYIRDSVETGLSAVLNGSATSLSLIIVDDSDDPEFHNEEHAQQKEPSNTYSGAAEAEDYSLVEKERLTLSFVRMGQVKDLLSLEQTERSMRDLIIRTLSLPNRKGQAIVTDSTSFRLVWHLEPNHPNYGEIPPGFDNGTWIEHKNSYQGGRIRRPLHQASSALVQVNFFSQIKAPVKPRSMQQSVVAASAKIDDDYDEDDIVL